MDIMHEVNPDHIPNIWYKNGNKVLYFRVTKVLYGCIELDILCYHLYGNTLKELRFVINPYDQCIKNKIMDEEKCTISWYFDANKVSHVNPKFNKIIIEAITIVLGI